MLYNAMAVPVLLHGSESWLPKKRERPHKTSSETRFLRYVKGCTEIDHPTNEDRRKELGIFSINRNIEKTEPARTL
jgi:hypothetical protein